MVQYLIKGVLFDWGNVLVDDPVPAVMDYCSDALQVEISAFLETYLKFGRDFQRGALDEDNFWIGICADLEVDLPSSGSLWHEAFEKAYRPRDEVYALAESIRMAGMAVGILSNTEPPVKSFFMNELHSNFSPKVLSFEEGYVKPEKEIYKIACNKLGLDPGDVAYFDDIRENVESARRTGIAYACQYTGLAQLKKDLKKII